jgi:hypothetical protein
MEVIHPPRVTGNQYYLSARRGRDVPFFATVGHLEVLARLTARAVYPGLSSKLALALALAKMFRGTSFLYFHHTTKCVGIH